MIAQIGRPAPDFTTRMFENGGFADFRLSDHRGHWVMLVFYPGDFTFVCPTELTAVANQMRQFKDLDCKVYGVSVDSVYVHKAWNDAELTKLVEGGLPYPLLADTGGHIGRLFGVYDDQANVDVRGRFIIDPDGVLQAMEILTPAVGRNIPEMLRQLRAFQHVRSTGGTQVCPAGWKEGEKVLRPSPELVGNVWREK